MLAIHNTVLRRTRVDVHAPPILDGLTWLCRSNIRAKPDLAVGERMLSALSVLHPHVYTLGCLISVAPLRQIPVVRAEKRDDRHNPWQSISRVWCSRDVDMFSRVRLRSLRKTL